MASPDDEAAELRAKLLAETLYRHLVVRFAAGKADEWRSPAHVDRSDPQYMRIHDFARALPPSGVSALREVVHRAAMDTLVSLFGLANGQYDVGLDKPLEVAYDGQAIGELVQDHLLALDAVITQLR